MQCLLLQERSTCGRRKSFLHSWRGEEQIISDKKKREIDKWESAESVAQVEERKKKRDFFFISSINKLDGLSDTDFEEQMCGSVVDQFAKLSTFPKYPQTIPFHSMGI